MSTYIIAITGASGAVYGIRLLEAMIDSGINIYLTVTKTGWQILKDEVGFFREGSEENINRSICIHYGISKERLCYYSEDNLTAEIASGSIKTDGMIIIPCSMKTAASIASGITSNLVERAADVIMKEKRRLIIVPRETPLNSIHLENLLTLSRVGVHIIPAMPAFYVRPESIKDIVDFIVGRVLDSLHIENNLYKRWTGK